MIEKIIIDQVTEILENEKRKVKHECEHYWKQKALKTPLVLDEEADLLSEKFIPYSYKIYLDGVKKSLWKRLHNQKQYNEYVKWFSTLLREERSRDVAKIKARVKEGIIKSDEDLEHMQLRDPNYSREDCLYTLENNKHTRRDRIREELDKELGYVNKEYSKGCREVAANYWNDLRQELEAVGLLSDFSGFLDSAKR